MADSLDEKQGAEKDGAKKSAAAARIKKMCAWLGGYTPAASETYTEEDEALYYGDGHSGWNR
jgi:hypothetical protein